MKKISIFAVVFILMVSLVIAATPKEANEPLTVSGNAELNNEGDGSGNGLQANGIKETGQETGEGIQSNIEAETKTQQQNKGEETQIQEQVQTKEKTKLKSGEYLSENGKHIEVQEQVNNRLQLKVGEASAQTSMELTQEQVQEKTRLSVKLSNGKGTEVKVMPDTASAKALERLRLKVCSEENNCQIELKEVGQGEQVKAAYEVQAQKEAKLFGLFKTKMQVKAQVDAENGEIIQAKKPWWAFLASEPEE